MSRLFAAFALMFAFVFTAGAASPFVSIDTADNCSVMADEKKDGEQPVEEEPDCD